MAAPVKKPHKWAKEIKAWADGHMVEWRCNANADWQTLTGSPVWDTNPEVEYRIKPERKVVWDWYVEFASTIQRINGRGEAEMKSTYGLRNCLFQKVIGTEREIEVPYYAVPEVAYG